MEWDGIEGEKSGVREVLLFCPSSDAQPSRSAVVGDSLMFTGAETPRITSNNRTVTTDTPSNGRGWRPESESPNPAEGSSLETQVRAIRTRGRKMIKTLHLQVVDLGMPPVLQRLQSDLHWSAYKNIMLQEVRSPFFSPTVPIKL